MCRGRALLLGAVALLACGALPARAQVVDTTLWACDTGGRVLAIEREDNTIYLGGNFTTVGPATGGGVPVHIPSATPLPRYPRVVGQVFTVIPDGEGGWFVGGAFTHVGSQPRSNLAHILADGRVADWAPDPDQHVWALLRVDRTLYVGGDFNFVGTHPRAHLAAFDVSSSEPLPWVCDINSRVTALLVRDPTLYVGGWFEYVAGQPRARVAAVDRASGQPTPWQVDIDDRVEALALADTTLFIGGSFRRVNGEVRRCLAAVEVETGALLAWNAGLDRTPITNIDGGPVVRALLPAPAGLYVAGSYSSLGGQTRRSLAQLDMTTALATAWDPRSVGGGDVRAGEYYSLALSGDTLFVAGWFDSLGGQPGRYGGRAAAVNAITGARLSWDPDPNNLVFALAVQRGVAYVGGRFTSLGEWVARHGLAALDATTGRVTEWNPAPSSYVRSILVHGGKVYVGGNFSFVGGAARNFIAALDPVTGHALPWNPGASWDVYELAPMRGSLLAAGVFRAIGGRPRTGLAAIDTASGLATDWDPQIGGDVRAIAVTDSVVYAGGDFLTAGGEARRSLVALDPTSGLPTPWNPGVDGIVDALAVSHGLVWVGGGFGVVGGEPRSCLAAIDRSGSVTAWAADADATVQALAVADSTVYVGGFFTTIAGRQQENLVALDARTGAIREGYPRPDAFVWSILAERGVLHVGGNFSRIGRWPHANYAAILPGAPPAPPEPLALSLAQNGPNPATGQTTIRFSLSAAERTDLTLYDLQGRIVSRPLARAWLAAGPHQVALATSALRPGCYVYRLDAGGRSATRKMVVVK